MADSPRPGVWSLEKSVDGGKTYTAWQYFAGNDAECQKYFGMHANMKIKNDDDVICVTEFSKVRLRVSYPQKRISSCSHFSLMKCSSGFKFIPP